MSIDKECYLKHVAMVPFQIGLDAGDWGSVDDTELGQWPYVLLWVKAAQKAEAPEKYYFRFNMENYPAIAPTACPWDVNKGQPLSPDKWPRGKKFVSKVFNPAWKSHALYAPCDRVAMEGHEKWAQKHKNLWWQPDFTIVTYLKLLHKLLNSGDYLNG